MRAVYLTPPVQSERCCLQAVGSLFACPVTAKHVSVIASHEAQPVVPQAPELQLASPHRSVAAGYDARLLSKPDDSQPQVSVH